MDVLVALVIVVLVIVLLGGGEVIHGGFADNELGVLLVVVFLFACALFWRRR